MKGVPVDMGRYIAQNEDSVAIGNGKMNARGDQIGPGGRVVKAREEVAREYHGRTTPTTVKQVSLKDLRDEVFASPADAWAGAVEEAKTAAAPKAASKKKIQDSED